MFKEFKAFAMKGNVMDLAIAVIIGGAFGKIVTSLVNDLVMPVIGIIIGGINLATIATTVKLPFGNPAGVTIKYGAFLQAVVDFLIIAFVIFMFTKLITKFKKKELKAPTVPAVPSNEELLLAEIRDLLKKEN